MYMYVYVFLYGCTDVHAHVMYAYEIRESMLGVFFNCFFVLFLRQGLLLKLDSLVWLTSKTQDPSCLCLSSPVIIDMQCHA